MFSLWVLSDSSGHMDFSPPGSVVPGILQARLLEWVDISSSRGSSWPRDQIHVSCTGRRILYHWATRKALITHTTPHQNHTHGSLWSSSSGLAERLSPRLKSLIRPPPSPNQTETHSSNTVLFFPSQQSQEFILLIYIFIIISHKELTGICSVFSDSKNPSFQGLWKWSCLGLAKDHNLPELCWAFYPWLCECD